MMLLALTQCSLFNREREIESLPTPRTWNAIRQSDTLRAITLRTCYTAFEYKGRWYGHEYEMARRVAEALGLTLDLQFVQSERELADSLFTGAADVAVWPASRTVFDSMAWLLPTGPRWEAEQVLVSARRLKPIDPLDTTATRYQLALVVGSRQWLAYHDDSVRAHYDFSPFVIDTIAHDSLTTDQLADAMIEGRTDMVMMRSNVARLMKDYHPTLKLSEPLPYSSDSVAWIIAQGADTLRMLIDSVCSGWTEMPRYDVKLKRVYEQQKGRNRRIRYALKDGALSPYDDIFKKYAREIDWDWRMLAAIGYIESKLDHTQVSSRGPIGLMQLMPGTVRALGFSEQDMIDPDKNVQVASILIGRLLKTLRNKLQEVSDRDLIQFTLAGYNAGLGHVYDAIYLADTLGYDIHVWTNNVEHCLRLKSNPDYYAYPNVKLGRFNGAFTINYIAEVLATYDEFCRQVGPDVEESQTHKKKK